MLATNIIDKSLEEFEAELKRVQDAFADGLKAGREEAVSPAGARQLADLCEQVAAKRRRVSRVLESYGTQVSTLFLHSPRDTDSAFWHVDARFLIMYRMMRSVSRLFRFLFDHCEIEFSEWFADRENWATT